MCRQTPSGPTSTQTPFEVALGEGCGAAEVGVVAAAVLPAAGAVPGAAPPLTVVPPPVPLLVPPPPWPAPPWPAPPWPAPPWPAPGSLPPRAPARPGDVASEEPARPGWVSCLLSIPWPGPPRPAARPCDVPEMGIAPAEATGEVPAADDWVVVRGVGRTRMETVENSRNAI